MSEPECHYCNAPAEYYCDMEGCDLPICRIHRVKIGHVCYRGKNKKLSGTIDYCRVHKENQGYE